MFATVALLKGNILATTFYSDVVFAGVMRSLLVEVGWTLLASCVDSITRVGGGTLRDRLFGRTVWVDAETAGTED